MLDWIISSSILIAILIFVRMIFKGKIRLTLQYALWGIVLARLLLPISIGSTGISAVNLKEKAKHQPAVQTVIEMGNASVSSQSYEDAYQQVVQQYHSSGIDVDALEGEALDAMKMEVQTVMKGKTVAEVLVDVMGHIWVTGIIVVSGMFLYTNARFWKKLRKRRINSGMRKGNIPVWICSDLDTPCLFGIFSPGIYISQGVLDDPVRLRHILEHEQTHYRHGDHMWSVLRGICVALHWYNPLVWYAAFLSQRDGELACDESTIKRLGESERVEYGRTLIDMTCRKKANVLATATTMNAGKNGIKERIRLIVKKPRTAALTIIVVLLIAAIAIGCTFTGAKNHDDAAQTLPTEEQLSQYFTSYRGEGSPSGVPYETSYIGSAGNFALVFYKGSASKLVLYHYALTDGQITVLSAVNGSYKLGKGITMNHLATEKGHLYFGTIADIRGAWSTLFLTDMDGKEYSCDLQGVIGFLCLMEAPISDFSVLTVSGSVATNMVKYLQKNEIVEASEYQEPVQQIIPIETIPPTETTEATEPNETVRSWPYGEYVATSEPYPPVVTPDGSDTGPLYYTGMYDKISIALYTTLTGGKMVHIIPENQEELFAALKKAYYSGYKSRFQDGDAYACWFVSYKHQLWPAMVDGSFLDASERFAVDASSDLYNLCLQAIEAANIPAPVEPHDIINIKSATLNWNGTHTVTDTESLQLIESLLYNSHELGYNAACPFGALLSLELTNGEIVTVTMATDSCDVWMSEGRFYQFYPLDDSGNDGNRPFFSLFAMQALHHAAGGHMENIPYLLDYLDWDQYGERYGDQETHYFMNQLMVWIQENYEERLLYAFWRLPNLNGNYGGAYAAMLTQLYEENPKAFAMKCLNDLYESQEESVLRLLSQQWGGNLNDVRGILQKVLSNA